MCESKEWKPKNSREQQKKKTKDEQEKENKKVGDNTQLLNSKLLGLPTPTHKATHIQNYTHFGSSAIK